MPTAAEKLRANRALAWARHHRHALSGWVALAATAFVVTWNAWLNDDAYIVFRTVDNFVHGYGLRWNVAERVQAFTCPLWTLLSAAAYAITREAYFTNIFLGVGLSVLTVGLLVFKTSRSALATAFAVTALLSSKAFTDYSTSGLENPLSHLLLVVFVLELMREAPGKHHLFRLSLIAALLLTNRMDHALLVGPALLAVCWKERSLRSVGQVLLGFTPFLAWELFAIAYYGFPFPNTAYAKLYTGIPSGQFLRQGLHYLFVSSWLDPLTSVALVASLGLALASRRRELILGAIGVVLYFVYVVRVGGDFMAGRFFSGPLVFAIALALSVPVAPRRWVVRTSAVVLTGFALVGPGAICFSELLLNRYWDLIPRPSATQYHGVADERAFYFRGTGLRLLRADRPIPSHGFRTPGDEDRKKHPDGAVEIAKTVGLQGYFAGPKIHYIDRFALTDPLLARMPTKDPNLVRVGHYERDLPSGYVETLRTGKPRFRSANVARYWQELEKVTRGPLWSVERWKAIVALNLRQYDELVRRPEPKPLTPPVPSTRLPASNLLRGNRKPLLLDGFSLPHRKNAPDAGSTRGVRTP